MTEHFKMDAPATDRRLDDMAQGLVGAPLDRPEGPLKVTGTATYANEWQIEGMAHGVMVRAPGNSGRVVLSNRDEVTNMPGVLSVIQDDRLLRNPAQGTANKAPVQGSQRTVSTWSIPPLRTPARRWSRMPPSHFGTATT